MKLRRLDFEGIAGGEPTGLAAGFGADEVEDLGGTVEVAEGFEIGLIGAEAGEFGEGVQVAFDVAGRADDEEEKGDPAVRMPEGDALGSADEEANALLEHVTVLMAEGDFLAGKHERVPGGKTGAIPQRFASQLGVTFLEPVVHAGDDLLDGTAGHVENLTFIETAAGKVSGTAELEEAEILFERERTVIARDEELAGTGGEDGIGAGFGIIVRDGGDGEAAEAAMDFFGQN